MYLIWYGLGRSWLEAIRIDPTSDSLLGIPANIWASFVAIALGVVLYVVQARRHPEPELSSYRAGHDPATDDSPAGPTDREASTSTTP